MDNAALTGGFANPPIDASHVFRSVLQAMARPGTIHDVSRVLPPAPISLAAGAVLLTLCDATTRLHLTGDHDRDIVQDWLTFQTGAPLVPANTADFVLGTWDAIELDALQIGTSEYPDRSATVIVELSELTASGATLRGPGIQDTASLNLPDLSAFQSNQALFPLGLDFIFTCGTQLAALPRSTRVS